jgi:hypothetical protein
MLRITLRTLGYARRFQARGRRYPRRTMLRRSHLRAVRGQDNCREPGHA